MRNRLNRTGDRDLAEVAFVAQSLFEIVPPDIFVEHPLIQDIGIRTLHLLTEQPPAFLRGTSCCKEHSCGCP